MSQVVEIKKPGDLWTTICLSGDTGLIHRRLIFVIYPKSGSLFLKSRLLKVPGLRTKHQQCIRQPFKMSLLLGVILSLMLSSVGKILLKMKVCGYTGSFCQMLPGMSSLSMGNTVVGTELFRRSCAPCFLLGFLKYLRPLLF